MTAISTAVDGSSLVVLLLLKLRLLLLLQLIVILILRLLLEKSVLSSLDYII